MRDHRFWSVPKFPQQFGLPPGPAVIAADDYPEGTPRATDPYKQSSFQHRSSDSAGKATRSANPKEYDLTNKESAETIVVGGTTRHETLDNTPDNVDYGTNGGLVPDDMQKPPRTSNIGSEDGESQNPLNMKKTAKIILHKEMVELIPFATTLKLQYISRVLCSGELRIVNLAALCDIDIGPLAFQRRVQHLVKMLGQDLLAEARSQIGKHAAMILRRDQSSTFVGQLIEWLTRAGAGAQRTEAPACLKRDMGNNEHDWEADSTTPFTFMEIEKILLDSNAYWSYRKRLLEITHKPYENRVLKALVPSGTASERPSIDCLGKLLDVQSVLLVARELSRTPSPLLDWSQDKALPVADRFKGLIESAMGEAWNWWPLRPRAHRLRHGFCRLSWQTVRILIFHY